MKKQDYLYRVCYSTSTPSGDYTFVYEWTIQETAERFALHELMDTILEVEARCSQQNINFKLNSIDRI